jgi:hypothetical protein
VLKLEPVELQQHEEEGGYRWHETTNNIAGKDDKLPWSEVQQRPDAIVQPTLVPWRLPSKNLPQHHKVDR